MIIPEKLIKHIDGRYEPRGLSLNPFAQAPPDGSEFPSGGQSLQYPFPRIQNGTGSVEAPELQGDLPQVRPAHPKGYG